MRSAASSSSICLQSRIALCLPKEAGFKEAQNPSLGATQMLLIMSSCSQRDWLIAAMPSPGPGQDVQIRKTRVFTVSQH